MKRREKVRLEAHRQGDVVPRSPTAELLSDTALIKGIEEGRQQIARGEWVRWDDIKDTL